jgi:hypothetical protein
LFLPAIRECFDLCQFRSFHGLRAGGVAVGGRRAAYVFGFRPIKNRLKCGV